VNCGLAQQEIVHAIRIYVVGRAAINQTRVGTLSNCRVCASAEASRNAIFAIELARCDGHKEKWAASGCWRPKYKEETPIVGTRYITSDREKCWRGIAAVCLRLR
jgi:hypothetical protein